MMSKSGGVARRTTPERMRGTTVLGVVLAMLAMLLTPVAAQAAPGDFAWGVVTVDANKNGAIDASGAAGQVDKWLAGAKVEIVDAADAVVAETVTGADGSWSIADVPSPDSGPYKVRVTAADANDNVYAFPASAADPNDFARGGAANVGLADLPADGELNALVYPIWSLDLALAANTEGLNGMAIRTGTGPFDANDSEPGDDSGMANDRVRSADIVSFNWSLTADSEESLGDSFTDVVFEQTIEMEPGAVVNFANRPAVCDPVKSTIVAQPSGSTIQAGTTPPAGTTSVTLSCYLGAMGEDKASYLFPTSVQPMATSENGSTFTTTSRAYAVDPTGTATAQPSAGVDSPPIEITAAPRYDVEKINGDAAGGYYGTQNIDGVPTYGMYSYYTVQISTDRTVGVEAFQQPITMQESFWAVRSVEGPNGEAVGTPISDLKWYITNCIPSPSPRSGQTDAGLVYGKIGAAGSVATAANSVRDSGTCSIGDRTTADTGSYTLSMNGIDTSGLSYPTQTVAGASLAAGPYYVASYRVQVFIPMSELDRTEGAADDGVGEFSIYNRVGDFDPVGTSGASNFGSGVEPGFCDAGPTTDMATKCDDMEDDTRSNNVVGPHTKRIAPGSWGKYFIDATTGWQAGYGWINGASNHDGSVLVQPGQAFSSMITLTNTATPWSDAQLCDVFDNTMLKLVPLNRDTSSSNVFPDDLYGAVLRSQTGVSLPSNDQQLAHQDDWEIKYGRVDLTGDDPNTGVFDTPNNRYEGTWTKQFQATNTTPQPLQVVIDSDPETVQEVGPFVNEFSAGTLDIAKALDGDAKDDAFLLDQQYTLDLVCQVAEGVDNFRGSVTLKPGAAQPVTVGDEPLLLPVGARCWIDGESVDQGAKAASFNFDGYDNAAIVVAQEDSAETQTLELSAVNTFDQATLTVSKKVVGPGTGKAYDFELACTYPVQGENGVEDVEYPLADGDAKFSLKDGQTKTVTVPAGVSCKVVETNVPDGATVTIEDSDGTTEGGVTDGEVTELEGTENFVQVTNTFPNPPLKNTGGELPVGALWAGAGLLVAGAALLLARRSRRDRAILGDRDSGGDI